MDIHSQQNQWQKIKAEVQLHLAPIAFSKWIAPLDQIKLTEDNLTITVPNSVCYHGLMTECAEALQFAKSQVAPEISLLINLPSTDGSQETESSLDGPEFDLASPKVKVTRTPDQQSFSRTLSGHTSLNRDYHFDSFVGGPSNQFALSSAIKVAQNPGQTYNPLFFYGDTGLGKTHLLYAIGNYVTQHNPSAVVTYVSSETFMNELVYCLRFDKMHDFRNKYRTCDVLLVDDIQFLKGNKKSTQEEFFHTFNALYEQKKQIVLTSDKFPQDIPDIEDRLRSRFQWGLTADIQTPDREHRIAILHQKARQFNIKLPHDVAELLASHHGKRNIRQLESAIKTVAAFADLQGKTIDINMVKETFQHLIPETAQQLTIEIVQKIVADHFKLRVTDLKSQNRQRTLTLPRQLAIYLSRFRTKASLSEIGAEFGGRDHTTILHAVRKITEDRLKDLDLKAHLESLERKIEQI
jgi:chromosomal replication initiator protein